MVQFTTLHNGSLTAERTRIRQFASHRLHGARTVTAIPFGMGGFLPTTKPLSHQHNCIYIIQSHACKPIYIVVRCLGSDCSDNTPNDGRSWNGCHVKKLTPEKRCLATVCLLTGGRENVGLRQTGSSLNVCFLVFALTVDRPNVMPFNNEHHHHHHHHHHHRHLTALRSHCIWPYAFHTELSIEKSLCSPRRNVSNTTTYSHKPAERIKLYRSPFVCTQ